MSIEPISLDSPPALALFDLEVQSERLAAKQAQLFREESALLLRDIQQLNEERSTLIKKEAEAYKSRTAWSTLATVAHYITGIATIVFGATCGGVAAVGFVAAGALGLANRVLHDTQLLDATLAKLTSSEELQNTLKRRIETGTFYLQIALSLASGAWAWRTGAFAIVRNDWIQKTTAILGTASSVMGLGSRFTAEWYKKKGADYEAALKLVTGDTTEHQQALTEATNRIESLNEATSALTDQIKGTLDTFRVSID